MSNARKCNRCRKCFDPMEAEGRMARFVNPIFQTSGEIQEYVRGQLLFEEMGPDGIVDLCPECSAQFRRFMRCEESPWSDQASKAIDQIIHRFERFRFPGGDTDGD